MLANHKIVCQNSKNSKGIFSNIDECLLWPGRTASTYQHPTHCQHRPQEHQRPAPTSTTARQSPRRASRPASLPSRKPSPVCRRAEESRRPCCRLPVQVEPRRWRGREGRERGEEGAAPAHSSPSQPAHTEPRPPAYTASPQRPPPPARLYRSRQAPAPPRLPCLLPSLKFCFWRENRTPPPKPPNLHGNRGPATCQRPPAMIGGGILHFQRSAISTI